MGDSDAISEVIAELMRTREELEASELHQIGNAQRLLSLIDVCLSLISRLSVQVSRTAELSTSGFVASTDAFTEIKGKLDDVNRTMRDVRNDQVAIGVRVSILEKRLGQVIDAVGT